MKIKKEDFERAISLAYQRGRVTPVSFIEQEEIDCCIADIYKLARKEKRMLDFGVHALISAVQIVGIIWLIPWVLGKVGYKVKVKISIYSMKRGGGK